jgi:hypothetical protein
MNRLTCPNFHESENWPFARISVKCAHMKKRGEGKGQFEVNISFYEQMIIGIASYGSHVSCVLRKKPQN